MENRKKVLIFVIGGISVMTYILYSIINNNKNDYTNLEIANDISIEEKTQETEEKNIILHITGAVEEEGVIVLKEGERIKDAIDMAGGTTEEADLSKINLAYELSDGQKIYIPSVTDEEERKYVIEGSGQNIIAEESELVNINTANQTELETITGIGPSTALKIINYRKENGKFNTIEDIKNVSGIGDAKFETIKEAICAK